MDKERSAEIKKGRQQFRRSAHKQRPIVRIVVVVPVVVVVVNTPTINIKPASLPKPLRTHHRLSASAVLTVEFNAEGLWRR